MAAGAAAVAAAGRIRLATALALLACATGARAGDIERITDYRSDVTVARDGALSVTEAITVNAQDDDIVHGIYRDFPSIYRQSGNVHVRFDVTDTTLDGHPTPHSESQIENGTRVQMGDANATLRPGLHTFVLRYTTDRQIGFFAKNDTLYWNVTGNGWQFAIDHASAVVHLPAGARILGTDFFTGVQGAHGGAAIARRIAPNGIAFETTQALGSNEGLTIELAFAKGAVQPPSVATQRAYLARDNAGAAGAAGGLALLFVYFGAMWVLVGRDPKRGVSVPLFEPPQGLSPAAVRFIHRMHYDRKAFAATLLSLAVKGVLNIRETPHFTGPVYSVAPRGRPTAPLSRGEADVADALLGMGGEETELSQKCHGEIASAIASLKHDLSDEYEGAYFNQNKTLFWPGLGIIALSCVAAAALSDDVAGAFLVFLWTGLFGVASALFAWYAFGAWRSVFAGPGARVVHIGIAVMRTVAALPFIAALIGLAFFLNHAIAPITVAILAVEAIVAVIFYGLLRAPTLAGARLRDAIDGFALYLKTAEEPRIAQQLTPALFEKYLPYAVALDCENAWTRKFQAATADAGTGSDASATGRPFLPIWYQGDSFTSLGTMGFVSSIGASIGDAVASASVAPGSGGGSGVGFSGGGGGGGGGW
ncbi:MAG TPA: DUF2207 domain-containing protein [Rhizomicrobium sp.]|nr:DUF2207 domain-containing protein [Rhizomicrobium sp.]